MKLTAQVVPYSSIVGGGVMLLDDKGKAFVQLIIAGGPPGYTAQDVKTISERLVARINENGGLDL